MEPILVFGATGETGRRVVDRLSKRGHDLRLVCRDLPRAEQLFGDTAQYHRGDVRDLQSLQGAADGVRTAICTIGTRSYFGRNGGAAVDAIGTQHLVQELVRAGSVEQLIFLSAFGLDRQSIFLRGFSLALNRYYHWKALAEEAVRSSGLSYTIVRPVELRNRAPRAAAWLNQSEPLTLLRTVSRDLVADVLAACVNAPSAYNKTFELCEAQGRGAPRSLGSIGHQLSRLKPDGQRPFPSRTPLC